MADAALKTEDDKPAKVVAKRKEAELPATQGEAPILSMLQRIMTDPSLAMERVNQAFDFYQRVRAEEASRAFLEAKVAFKAVAPAITKDKTNKQYDSTYASIGNVVNKGNEALSKHGLDASWDIDQTAGIKVTCILKHVLGHSERVSLTGPPDVSGAKNPLQQIKSTLTYLKLATFEAVTGIATKEGNVDDDGNASGMAPTVSAEQLEILQTKIKAVGADTKRFCIHMKVPALGAIKAGDYERAIEALEAKARSV